MRFFGDRSRDGDPRELAAGIEGELRLAARLPPGLARHAAVAAALVRAGELAQGLGDAADLGQCGAGPAREALAEAARLARGLWRSFEAGGRAPAPAAAGLPLRGAPERIRVRRAEGHAFYAVYPEAYALAGRALRGAPLTCVGLRSIGAGLAAAVAAGAGAAGPVFAVRPGGPPFARRLEPAALGPILSAGRGGAFAVVDEGPGLSGSTLAAVAAALLEAGVAPDRVHLFTGHAGPPGPEASPHVRAIFARLPRHAAPAPGEAGTGLLAPAAVAADLVGPAQVEAELGDGGWRRLVPGGAALPSTGWMERRKVLLRGEDGRRWLARFAGLGPEGARKLARAQALAAAGVGLAPVGLRHGWLLEPWRGDAQGLDPAASPRSRLLAALGRLLAVAARRPAGEGAGPEELAAMARANAAEALGPEAGERARRLEAHLPRLAAEARPAEVDGRLQPWKWRALGGRRLVKCDAVDHHAGHELSGCQDLLWDVAGAEAELGLSPREAWRLAEAARAVAPGADPALLPFYRVCYRALELGRWWYAAQAAPDGEERRRREAERERYRRGLGEALLALEMPRIAAPSGPVSPSTH